MNGKIEKITPIDGEYFTVSPMAVRADVDVFTKNKRVVTVINSPEFGRVIFVAVGATMVGRYAENKQTSSHKLELQCSSSCLASTSQRRSVMR